MALSPYGGLLLLQYVRQRAGWVPVAARLRSGQLDCPWGESVTELGIDGYDSAEPLGRGGFGSVYRARQIAFNRTVAIKVFHAEMAGRESLDTFERECRAIGQLDWCPSIVTVFSSGMTAAGEPYIVMEYAPGGSLASHIAAGPLDESAARRILGRIALALATAHEAGILHRDVKPGNILISRGDEPILADFGIARLFAGGATTTGTVAGTVAFTAPEIWSNVPASPQSDIFSLGATIYATLTGRGPFSSVSQDSVGAMLARAMSGVETDVDSLGVSRELKAILGTCLRLDPAARFASARELLDEVAPFGLGGATKPIPVLRNLRPDPTKGASRGAPVVPGIPVLDRFEGQPEPVRPAATRVEDGSRRWGPEYYQSIAYSTKDGYVSQDEMWPSATDYARLVQAQRSLLDASPFAGATVVRDSLGMPMSASGQNAIVFEFAHRGGPIALRCFTRPPVGAAARYRELGKFLARRNVGSIVPSVWVSDVLADDTRRWPAVVMPWVDGVPLNVAVEDMLDRPATLTELAGRWRCVVASLVEARVAHGDIQCGNVLVDPELNLNLVDLDGVYAPGMTDAPSEVGHPNFQHPRRDQSHWGPDADAFSFLVMALSLEALAANPRLWRYHNGENLIFSREDFLRPGFTPVWRELAASPSAEVVRLANELRGACLTFQPPSLAHALRVLGIPAPVTTPATAAPESDSELQRTVARVRGGANAPIGADAVAAAVQDDDKTVVRAREYPPTIRRPVPTPPSAALAPGGFASGGGAVANQWWSDEADAESTSVAALEAEAASGQRPAAAGEADGSDAPAVGLFGRNAILTGIMAGLVAGLTASVATESVILIAGESLPIQYWVAVFLILVGGFLTAALSGMASAAMGAWRQARVKAAAGFAAGGGMSLVGLGLFQVFVGRNSDLMEGPAPFSFLFGGWLLVAVAVGVAAGLIRQSRRAVLSGLYGGAVGGFLGAALHWSSQPWIISLDEGFTALLITPLALGTLFPVLLACICIGGAIGTVDRLLRRHWLTIIEGRGRGLELILDQEWSTIGSHPSSTMLLSAPGVLAEHVGLKVGAAPVMRANGPVERNGALVAEAAEIALESGDVLRVGGSFIRFESRVGRTG